MLDSHTYKVVGTRKEQPSLSLYKLLTPTLILPSYNDKVDDPSSLYMQLPTRLEPCDNYLFEFLMEILGLKSFRNSSECSLACSLKVIWILRDDQPCILTPSGLLDFGERTDVQLPFQFPSSGSLHIGVMYRTLSGIVTIQSLNFRGASSRGSSFLQVLPLCQNRFTFCSSGKLLVWDYSKDWIWPYCLTLKDYCQPQWYQNILYLKVSPPLF